MSKLATILISGVIIQSPIASIYCLCETEKCCVTQLIDIAYGYRHLTAAYRNSTKP